ncbi:DUF1206 domain-containing protein [Sediminibacillus albus]|uniref:DUF1206 domain-containing protein n=1 Tax=Sediminibacillus albus TaxID=407036 RepID=A0A1G8YD66_9BACI|nr:DUF1206 domain-containing protein [Sediminibacillus albus]SDJ99980.1 protein of unknown function [Sediminibacillus albus]
MDIPTSKYKAKQQTTLRADQEIKPWIRWYGRLGYMAQGVVFALIGILSFMAAIGVGGKTASTSGMFQSLANMPLGEILIWIIGIGLLGYIVWQLIRAVKDPGNYGNGFRGIVIRVGFFVSAVIYGAISMKAIQIAVHAGSSNSGSEQAMSAKLLSQPFGPWVLAGLGTGIFIFGGYELFSGIKGSFMKKFKKSEMKAHEKKTARNAGRIGMISRGIIFGLVGFFFVRTALTTNPDKAKGLDGALAELAKQPFGQWMLGIVSVGFILFGLYQIIRGRYEYMSFGR